MLVEEFTPNKFESRGFMYFINTSGIPTRRDFDSEACSPVEIPDVFIYKQIIMEHLNIKKGAYEGDFAPYIRPFDFWESIVVYVP